MKQPSQLEQVNRWCQSWPAATRTYPFGEQVAVYKVGGKMFAMVSESGPPETVTLKSPPSECEALVAQYDYVRPGYYMNKRHWITIDLQPQERMTELPELIQTSYDLVASKLTKKVRSELGLADKH